MGSFIEVNDTLLLTAQQGFPVAELDVERHMAQPVTAGDMAGRIFHFRKGGARLFHLAPVRVFLAEHREGKWLMWGKVTICSQTIAQKKDAEGRWQNEEWETSGTFTITEIYDPGYQQLTTKRECPAGKSYF